MRRQEARKLIKKAKHSCQTPEAGERVVGVCGGHTDTLLILAHTPPPKIELLGGNTAFFIIGPNIYSTSMHQVISACYSPKLNSGDPPRALGIQMM